MPSAVHETRPAVADRLLGIRHQGRPTWTHSLRCLIDLSTTAQSLHETIHLSENAQGGIAWWLTSLRKWNGQAITPGWNQTRSLDFELFTDAAASNANDPNSRAQDDPRWPPCQVELRLSRSFTGLSERCWSVVTTPRSSQSWLSALAATTTSWPHCETNYFSGRCPISNLHSAHFGVNNDIADSPSACRPVSLPTIRTSRGGNANARQATTCGHLTSQAARNEPTKK